MVSSPVSGKVFAAELSDPLPRSEPPPPLPGLSAVMAAASVMLSLLFAPPLLRLASA